MKKKRKGRLQKFEERNRNLEERQSRKRETRKREKRTGSSYNRRTVTLIVIILIAVLGISLKNIFTLQSEQRALTKENEALLLEKESLQDELKNVNDAEYIEEQARIQLKLIKPGEIMYILEEQKKDNDKKNEKED